MYKIGSILFSQQCITVTTFITYIKKNIIFGQGCYDCTIMVGR